MNIELIKLAQAQIAQGISDHPVLGPHAKPGKIETLFKRFSPAVAGIGLVALMGIGGAVAPAAAQAQPQSVSAFSGQTSPRFPGGQNNQGSSVNDQRQRQADLDLQRRIAQQAANEARQRQNIDDRTNRIMGDVAGNLGAAVSRSSGANNSQSNSAGTLGRAAVNVARGAGGNNTTDRVAIGASVGAALGDMMVVKGNNKQSVDLNRAVGATLGVLGALAWDQAAQNQVPNSPTLQPGDASVMVAGGRRTSRFTRVDTIPEVRITGNSLYSATAKTTAGTPSGPAVPAVMLEVMKANGIFITPPGVINVQLTATAMQAEPVIDFALTKMAVATDSMVQRMALIELAADMRGSENFNQIEVGNMSRRIVKADQEVRGNIAQMIIALNNASSAGFDTTPMMKTALQVVNDCYVSDDIVKFNKKLNNNAKYWASPQ